MKDLNLDHLGHDLRSQLGLIPGRRAEELSSQIEAALRIEPKPANPATAPKCILGETISVTINPARDSIDQLARRVAKGVNPAFIANGHVTVTVVNKGEQSLDKDEIVSSIRKMIDRPEVQHVRRMGRLTAGPKRAIDVLNAAERLYGEPVDPSTLKPYEKRSIQIDEPSMTGMSRTLRFDARALARLIPQGIILIKGMDPADYVGQFCDISGVLEVTYDDIKSVGKLTVDQASVLRSCGLHAVGGYFLGGPVNNAPTHRALSKIHDHVESLESDILEMLGMAGANPHADVRRLASARTQFELAFMMMKKAVDPEQERQ